METMTSALLHEQHWGLIIKLYKARWPGSIIDKGNRQSNKWRSKLLQTNFRELAPGDTATCDCPLLQ